MDARRSAVRQGRDLDSRTKAKHNREEVPQRHAPGRVGHSGYIGVLLLGLDARAADDRDACMGILDNIRSLAAGTLWLVRWGGLRRQLIRLEQRINELEQLIQEKTRSPGALQYFEDRVYSQNGEDGILRELFRRIGTDTRFFVEFGAHPDECNCARLAIEEGWSGLFMDMDDERYRGLCERFRDKPGVRCVQAKITSQNIEELLAAAEVPDELDLLSIDIDSNDYWVWNAIRRWRPRAVAIEYNAHFRPPIRWVMKENPDHRWDGSTYFGASLTSLAELGRQKGYRLVGTDSRGVNAFFVRDDLAEGHFAEQPVSYHYNPPRYGLHELGHPEGSGPFVEI